MKPRWARWALLGLIGCGGSSHGQLLRVSTEVEPLDALTVSIFSNAGALVLDREVNDGGLDLDFPLYLELDSMGAPFAARILVWGRGDDSDAAFGVAATELAPDREEVIDVLLKGPPSDCDGDRVPDAHDDCPGVWDPEQADADGSAPGDACTPGAGCPGNLIVNPGFESGIAGWDESSDSELTQVAGGQAGSDSAARICKLDTGALDTIDVDMIPVTGMSIGDTYRLDAWVRTTTGSGQVAVASLDEEDSTGSTVESDDSADIILTADWQVATVTHVAVQNGTRLQVEVQLQDAPDGDCFDVDNVCLVRIFPDCQ